MTDQTPRSAPDLIGDRLRSLIGVSGEPRTGIVHKVLFQRWAVAVKDHNPLYFDPEAARRSGYRDVIMPPAYVVNVFAPLVPLDQLRPDGLVSDSMLGLDVLLPSCPKIMGAGVDMAFHTAVYDADVLTGVLTVTGAVQKYGRRTGDFVLLSRTLTCRKGSELVAEITRHVIARP